MIPRRVQAVVEGTRVWFMANTRDDLAPAWVAAMTLDLSPVPPRHRTTLGPEWWEFEVTTATARDAWALAAMLETADERGVLRKAT